jgi:Na+-driven multidrug efflux pump
LGFYSNLIFGLLVTIICCGGGILLIDIEQGNSLQSSIDSINSTQLLTNLEKETVINIYRIATSQINKFALDYIYFMGACSIFALYTQFFSLLIIAEGKQGFVVAAAIFCNVLNLVLD